MDTSGKIVIPELAAKRLFEYGGIDALNNYVTSLMVIKFGESGLPFITVVHPEGPPQDDLVLEWTLMNNERPN